MAHLAIVKKEVADKKKESKPVDLIITHNFPHFDEALAIYFLKNYGSSFFPGVENASVETWGEGKMLSEYHNKTANDLLNEQKMLCVGIGSGMFDEHVNKDFSCAHLIARYLEIIDLPELQRILNICKRVDHDGKSMSSDLHSLMKDGYDYFNYGDEGTQEVLDWATKGIVFQIHGQMKFFQGSHEFEKNGKIINGGPFKIALVKSDNYKIAKWTRYSQGSPEIIIQKTSSGNTQIYTGPKISKTFQMRDLVRIVRMMELQKRKKVVPEWQILEKEGNIPECGWWYYYKIGEQLLNGTITSPDIEPTRLNPEDITKAIALACAPIIDPCVVERCSKACPKYKLGLIACRQKRFKAIEQKA